jgi:hypothetical protein
VLFIAFNTNLESIGQPTIIIAPQPSVFPQISILSIQTSAGGNIFGIDLNAAIPTGFSLIVQATPPLSPGILFMKNRFRQVQVFPGNTATPLDIQLSYDAKFGALIQDMRVGIKAYLISESTGQAGTPFFFTDIILA